MYNRYIHIDGFVPSSEPPPAQEAFCRRPDDPPSSGTPNRQTQNFRSPLQALFGDRFKLPELSQENLLLLVLVYFLVTDDGDKPGDVLPLIAALFLLGL